MRSTPGIGSPAATRSYAYPPIVAVSCVSTMRHGVALRRRGSSGRLFPWDRSSCAENIEVGLVPLDLPEDDATQAFVQAEAEYRYGRPDCHREETFPEIRRAQRAFVLTLRLCFGERAALRKGMRQPSRFVR